MDVHPCEGIGAHQIVQDGRGVRRNRLKNLDEVLARDGDAAEVQENPPVPNTLRLARMSPIGDLHRGRVVGTLDHRALEHQLGDD